MPLNSDLREFLESLNSNEVKYLVVGGYAVGFHGAPRYTGDLDVVVEKSSDNAARVMQTLMTFGFGNIGLGNEDFLRPNHVVQLGHPPNRIDILTGISGVTFEEAWNSRVQGELDGVPVNFIGREQLIRNKQSSGRSQDLADAEKLVKRKG